MMFTANYQIHRMRLVNTCRAWVADPAGGYPLSVEGATYAG